MYNVSRKFHNLNHSIELDSIFAGKEKIMMSQYKQFYKGLGFKTPQPWSLHPALSLNVDEAFCHMM